MTTIELKPGDKVLIAAASGDHHNPDAGGFCWASCDEWGELTIHGHYPKDWIKKPTVKPHKDWRDFVVFDATIGPGVNE